MNHKSILLVEDNPDDAELTLLAFQKEGLNDVVVARDGLEALEHLFVTGASDGGHGFVPRVILLDLKLPRLGGLDVLERIRANADTAFIPVVVMTSSTDDEDLILSYRLGANSYVRKPVGFHAFSEAVQRVGLYWLHVNETRRAKDKS